jgi:threonine aldolase
MASSVAVTTSRPVVNPADFRSDTVTRPTAAMRTAMAEAVVGDDVLGDDPTVQELEREVAALFGKAAALFVSSGSQGNQIAARVHTRSGEEVAVGDNSHTYDWEMAGLAANAGLQARPLPAVKGRIDVEAVRETLRDAGGHRPACRLLLTENTHNFHGGAIVPLEHLQALRAVADEKGARVHLDGARLWNAAAATGVSLDAWAATADSAMACLSKGLGAPIGSVLVGEADFIAAARDVRKMLGGGMRQVGVLAAPALVALRDHRERLTEDHARAAALAEGFLGAKDIELPYGAPETNIVFVRAVGRDAAAIQAALEEVGVLAFATGSDVLRFVTHYDVDDADVERAIAAFLAAV